MPLPRIAIVVLTIAGSIACGGSGDYRRTGGYYAGRGPDCAYRVIRNRIVEPYEEIGVVDIDAFGVPQLPSNEIEFRKVVGEYVCMAGGHAVVPSINMYGRWVRGTVIRFRPSECDRCRSGNIMRGPEVDASAVSGGEG